MSIEKVIMVAQEEFLRKQVAQYLRKKRIDVAECGNIQEAHDFLGKGNFDLMLLDESLPDGSGAEFLVEVNLRPAKPMVVMMGAEGSVDIAAPLILPVEVHVRQRRKLFYCHQSGSGVANLHQMLEQNQTG